MSDIQTAQVFGELIQGRFAGQSGWFCLGTIDGDPDLEKMKQEWYLLPLSTAELTETAEVPLTIENVAPVADAGADQSVDLNQAVTLNGSGSSDANGDSLAYSWAQTGGPLVNLSSTTANSPSFAAPATYAVLTFRLTVTDSLGVAAATPDDVVVMVSDCASIAFPYTVPAGDSAGLINAIGCANVDADANVINLTNSTYTFTTGDVTNGDAPFRRSPHRSPSTAMARRSSAPATLPISAARGTGVRTVFETPAEARERYRTILNVTPCSTIIPIPSFRPTAILMPCRGWRGDASWRRDRLTMLLLGAAIIAFGFNRIFVFISDANHGRHGAYTLISGLETMAPELPV